MPSCSFPFVGFYVDESYLVGNRVAFGLAVLGWLDEVHKMLDHDVALVVVLSFRRVVHEGSTEV